MRTITAVTPEMTKSVSVTGKDCSLCCSHCGRRYLAGMEDIRDTIARGPRSFRSALVSGGMNEAGRVPLDEHLDEIRQMRDWGWRINVHTGLMKMRELGMVAPNADAISIDFVYDRLTIEEVYGTDAVPGDYTRLIEDAREFMEPAVHLTIGLFGGEIRGEYEAIRTLSEMEIKRLVFLVMIPTRGTRYEGRRATPLSEVESLISTARDMMPDAAFSLGCMHPRGRYACGLDDICIRNRFETVTMPGEGFRLKAAESSLKVIEKKECCAL